MSTKAAAETIAPEVTIGTVFVSSWGYDQTNVDFYMVVGRTAKSVRVQPWGTVYAESTGPHDSVMVGSGPKMETDWSDVTPEMDFWERQEAVKMVPAPIMTKRLIVYGDSVFLRLNSYSNAYVWDGSAQYQTGAGYGH